MLDWLNSFTVLIQTITAVNFAYILSKKFSDDVFDLFFSSKTVDSLYEWDNNEISADIASLKSIDLDGIFRDAANPKENRESLLGNYTNLREKWDNLLKNLKDTITNAKAVKGFKCLFLAISLFCLVSLFNISILDAKSYELSSSFWLSFIVSFNILTFIYSIFLTIIIFTDAWRNLEKESCYKTTILIFIITVLLSLCLAFANERFLVLDFSIAFDQNPVLVTIIFALCAFLPFYPCLVSILYVVYKLTCFRIKANKETSTLRAERKELHAKKEKFDNVNDVYKRPEIKFE